MKKRSSYYPADPHHSEAVADCIEFIKKSSLTDQEEINRDSTASSSFDDTGEMAMPVPVT
jgi:COMPASS component SWD2